MTNTPTDGPNLQEVIPRNLRAREILSRADATHPAMAEIQREIDAALLDAATLIHEILRIRNDIANLAAAARASIKAYDDDIPNPLWFLRDELTAQGWTNQGHA